MMTIYGDGDDHGAKCLIMIMTMITMMIPMIDPNTGGSGRPPGYLQPHQGEVAAENIMSLLTIIYDKNDDRICHLVVKVLIMIFQALPCFALRPARPH